MKTKTVLQDVDLIPLFQQIVDLKNPLPIVGYEALISGRYQEKFTFSAKRLFEIASDQNAELELDKQARELSVHLARDFIGQRLLFLNCHEKGLQDEILSTIEGLPPHQIVLEIPEQAHKDIIESAIPTLYELRKLGVKIALDDFGTGISNFWMVETLEPDFIKLDRSIMATVEKSTVARKVVEGMVAFSNTIGTSLIAEGIETKDQARIANELGVHYGQGFYWGLPFSLE